jgi:hypothetical protein
MDKGFLCWTFPKRSAAIHRIVTALVTLFEMILYRP